MRWWFSLVVAGCYAPSYTTGAPCETDADCPAHQSCAADRHCGGGVGIDAPPIGNEAVPFDCWAQWFLPTGPKLSAPRRVDELSSQFGDTDGSLAEGDLAIYIERNDGTGNGPDIYRATRASVSGVFGGLAVVSAFQSTVSDSRVSTAANDTIGVFASARPGGAGLVDLWYVARASIGDAWSTPSQTMVANVVDAMNQFDPELSPDGLHLYFAPDSPAPQHIAVASRTTINQPFGAPAAIALPTGRTSNYDVTISFDERVIVFASSGGADADLFVATRATTANDFGTPVVLSALVTPQQDADPEISRDGCRLYFSSNRTGSMNRDIYVTDVMP